MDREVDCSGRLLDHVLFEVHEVLVLLEPAEVDLEFVVQRCCFLFEHRYSRWNSVVKGGRSTEGYFAGTDFDPPVRTLSKEVSSKFRSFFIKTLAHLIQATNQNHLGKRASRMNWVSFDSFFFQIWDPEDDLGRGDFFNREQTASHKGQMSAPSNTGNETKAAPQRLAPKRALTQPRCKGHPNLVSNPRPFATFHGRQSTFQAAWGTQFRTDFEPISDRFRTDFGPISDRFTVFEPISNRFRLYGSSLQQGRGASIICLSANLRYCRNTENWLWESVRSSSLFQKDSFR